MNVEFDENSEIVFLTILSVNRSLIQTTARIFI